jgi:YVTN family beta-propeller protein
VITYSLFPSAFVCVAGPLRNLKRRAVPSGTILLLLIVCAPGPSAWLNPYFVVNKFSNTVAVIDSSTDQIITQIPVDASPVRICMSPDRLKAYVSNGQDATASVIDAVTLATSATIPVGASPQESAVTPDGGRLFLVMNRPPASPSSIRQPIWSLPMSLSAGTWPKTSCSPWTDTSHTSQTISQKQRM